MFETGNRFVFAPKLTCFQLGGTHHADVLSEWLLYTQAPGSRRSRATSAAR